MSTSGAETLRLHVHVEIDEAGMHVAQVKELPGCISQGATLEEALTRLTDLIPVYMQVAFNRTKPRPIGDTSSSGGSQAGSRRDFELAIA